MNHDMTEMRKSYEKYTLSEEDAGLDPILFFQKWFSQAKEEKAEEPNAMVLSTVSQEGQPSSRVVLLKEIAQGEFVFYTNYDSRKGKEMAHNPKVALTFFWHHQERQIRIEGTVKKVSKETSLLYFDKRPRVSQLGALASHQSRVVPDRLYLETILAKLEKDLDGRPVPMPEAWGGYSVNPSLIEFWQGRRGRLHDRLEFLKTNEGWKRQRLSP
ncbi:pyridoxamine 5'-phosphate oxidase [Leptospira ognonensis]|uniref:Pyridoxine/pyridoxamine 5'-phosphate oxidase n=1 Tax=Leptospira ognonensis TaxID=2484945 RepID=A0A4V3JSH5_9LEPT|nr:pyridoxamine 5'-phosphate oxidase [Leptospira ognonensis]TGL63870.1 pyridoxamine 5'-phosphate oxidase [Leptospira ognonensis]